MIESASPAGCVRRWDRVATLVSIGALGLALAPALLPAAALGQSATGAVWPGTMGQGPVDTCFWGQPSSNVGPIDELDYPVAGTNVGALDTNVVYYYTRFQLPAGATVTLHGQYPHARFFSLTTYVTKAGVPGYPSTSIYDEQIDPDPGPSNPFRPGEARDSAHRSYTVTISGQVPPTRPAPNTLYAGQTGNTGEAQQVEMTMRIYRPDRNLEANAGVPLPKPTLNPQRGSPIREEAAACSALQDTSGIAAITSRGLPVASYLHLRELAPAPHPADDPIVWERFFNPLRLLEPFLRGAGEPYEELIGALPSTLTSGLYATPANAYILGFADRTIGPNSEGHNILVLHARMPTHPETYDDDTINDSAGTQVRYWSICAFGAIADPPILPADSACLFDQEVPTNTAGDYTLVVSLPEDRPANATPGCGVAWLNWGTAGDALQGEYESDRRSTLDLLVMRNQLSSPTFAQSIADVTTPGTEEQVMGAYYPHGTYMTKREFEGRTCRGANP
jgi:hypothetical protein